MGLSLRDAGVECGLLFFQRSRLKLFSFGSPLKIAKRSPGNGTLFVGSNGHMATTARGEGVWLLPSARWAEYKLPPQILPRSETARDSVILLPLYADMSDEDIERVIADITT